MPVSGPKPFLKWAGGKGQVLPAIEAVLPFRIKGYYEPFLGGGAVFWALASSRRFESARLNDWNQELVNTYEAVRDEPEALLQTLDGHKKKAWNTREYFNEIRAQDPWKLSPIDRAARMIYLNKTCFNGLYRVNKKHGEFNTPFGDYRNPALADSSNIRACSQALQRNVTLTQGDFQTVFQDASPGDLVYFDPPYVPLSTTANFASYTSAGFGMADQSRLASCLKELADRDVSFILSNHDTEATRKLYEGFEIVSVQVKRNINSKADKRGHVGELLVVHRGSAHRVSTKFDYASLGE
jgi:DNA adenine methylase